MRRNGGCGVHEWRFGEDNGEWRRRGWTEEDLKWISCFEGKNNKAFQFNTPSIFMVCFHFISFRTAQKL